MVVAHAALEAVGGVPLGQDLDIATVEPDACEGREELPWWFPVHQCSTIDRSSP